MTSMLSETALFVSGWVELSILSKATIILALGWIASGLAGRGRASMRHLFLGATFGMLLVLPLIMLAIPAATVDIPVSRAAEPTGAVNAVPASGAIQPRANAGVGKPEPASRQWPSWQNMLRLSWAAGTAALLLSLLVGLWRLRQIRRNGLPWPELRELTRSLAAESGLRRTVEVILHEDIAAPLTCGVWRPAVIFPTSARDWSEAQIRRALVHELEHVRRGDWVVQLEARATCAFYWFHPLVWVAWRRLGLEAERACDDAVVQNAERADYAEQLVLLAQQMSRSRAHPALGMANRSDLSTRVSAVLDRSQKRGRVGWLAAALAIGAASILVLVIAPARAVTRSTQAGQQTRSSTIGTPRAVSAVDRALFEAAENGDISDISQLLDAGANVNCAIDGDGSPLITAARKGRLAAVRLLLDRGADPNMPVSGDGNPLIMAAREGHADVVTLLLDRGARIDEVVPSDENALIQASGAGQLAVVKLLVTRGANVNLRVWVARNLPQASGEWRSPLILARKKGHDEVVAFLLAAGAREE